MSKRTSLIIRSPFVSVISAFAFFIALTLFQNHLQKLDTFLGTSSDSGIVYAQGCKNSDCPGGYACQGGTMCCTGNGCPSTNCPSGCTAGPHPAGWTCTCKYKEPQCTKFKYKCQTGTKCYNTYYPYDCSTTSWKKVCYYGYCKYVKKVTKKTCYKKGKECYPTYGQCTGETCKVVWKQTKTVYKSTGTCKGCSAGTPPPAPSPSPTPTPSPTTCTVNPAAVNNVSPPDGTVIKDTKDVDFEWSATSDWGANCSSSLSYRLQIDDENSFSTPLTHNVAYGSSTTDATVTISDEGDYYWRVQACNTNGCSNSSPWQFSMQCGTAPGAASNPTPADGENDVAIPVTTEWDAPSDWGTACGQANNNTYTVFAKVKTGATCDDPGATYSAVPSCTGLASSRTDCNDPFFSVRNTDFCWYVETNNGTETTLSGDTGDDVWEFRTADPALYQNWVTTLFGDFYAGGLAVQYPGPSQYVAPWDPPHAAYDDGGNYPDVSLLASNNVDITTSDTTSGYSPESESGLWVEYADFKQTWPSNYRGTPPASAISLPLSGSCDEIFTGSDKLSPFEVYEGDASCISDAMNAVASAPNGYELDDDGYAVVFVTGSSDLQIDSAFTTDNDDYRVVFVTGPEVSVKIDRGLSLAANPDFSSDPLIEAAFIVTKDMEFEGVASDPLLDPATDPDDSIMVEGPIIAKTVEFNRNRGANNQYPSEIVKYNPNYIYNLTEQERSSLKSNGSGLFVIDVDWTTEE